MADPLFRQYNLSSVLEAQKQALSNEIASLAEDRILNTSPSDLSKYFVDKYTIEPIKIDEEGIHQEYADTQIDVSNRFNYAVFDRSRPAMVSGTRIALFVPFTGDSELFRCQPSTYSLGGGINAIVQNEELFFSYDRTTSELASVRDDFMADIERLKKYLKWIEGDVHKHNDELAEAIDQLLSNRREKILNDRSIVASLGYPLKRRSGAPTTYTIPEVKRRITPQLPSPSTEPFSPEPELHMDHYEHILSVISNMVAVMEQSPQAFQEMREEDLRQHFLVQLNGHYEGSATAETFNYEGKTDILIKDRGKNIFVAECKFWNGPSSMTKTIDQILGYLSWRDTKAAIVVFNRNRDMTRVLAKIPGIVKEHPSFKSERSYDAETGYRYIMGHRDDHNRDITLTILVFDIPS